MSEKLMVAEEQIITALAEYEGWMRLAPFKVGRETVDWPVWEHPETKQRASFETKTLPHYPTDLRAMERVFKKMAGEGWVIRIVFSNRLKQGWKVSIWKYKNGVADPSFENDNESLSQAMFDCACKALIEKEDK
jgi:hypothetical protein